MGKMVISVSQNLGKDEVWETKIHIIDKGDYRTRYIFDDDGYVRVDGEKHKRDFKSIYGCDRMIGLKNSRKVIRCIIDQMELYRSKNSGLIGAAYDELFFVETFGLED